MDTIPSIFNIRDEREFEKEAIRAFEFQVGNNNLYRDFVYNLGLNIEDVDSVDKIPFLPIEFFKTKRILIGNRAEKVFYSSGTTGNKSQHYVKDISVYKQSFSRGFEKFYGNPSDYVILALLPSYIENGDSSLIFMVSELIAASENEYSGFYLYNYEELYKKLLFLKSMEKKVLLFGVTYALLDFGNKFKIEFPDLTIIETGGMKGQMKEITKEELYSNIVKIYGTVHIHSEYGMTELLSQAYSLHANEFHTVPWMKILIRDLNDPLSYLDKGKIGGINVIDLANKYSCPFIETKDIGMVMESNCFQVLGRVDNSDIRGCNLMIFS